MFFKSYNLHENKLSEQLSDDNPYKKKLIQMETPSEKHPIYTGLVWGLLIYSWIFFIILISSQIRKAIMSEANLLIFILNIIFITFSILLCYKRDFMVSQNFKDNCKLYIIFITTFIFSIFVTTEANNIKTSWSEILRIFFYLDDINNKSYLAQIVISYCALGIAMSYYSCPYKIYQAFYSAHQTYHEYKSEKILINKSLKFLFLCVLVFLPFIYSIFNSGGDYFTSRLRNLSIFFICGSFHICTIIFVGKMYYKYYEKAIKYQKEVWK